MENDKNGNDYPECEKKKLDFIYDKKVQGEGR